MTPKHYQARIQPIEFIRDWKMSFAQGNIVKYLCRAGKKDDYVVDIGKAVDYFDEEIECVIRYGRKVTYNAGTIKADEFLHCYIMSYACFKALEMFLYDGGIEALKDAKKILLEEIDRYSGRKIVARPEVHCAGIHQCC